MRTTFQELQDLFHLKDDRQIKVGLVNKIKVIEDGIEVTDAKLANLIEKFRNGGSLTLKDVCKQYDIALSELNYLVKVNKIPYYRLVSQRGSQMLFLRSDLENENVLNLFIYKGINTVKFVKLVLKLIDEIEGISDRDKTLLTLHFVEGKTVSEIANINKSKKSTINAQIQGASRRLLHNFRYLNSQAENAKKYKKKYEELKIKFDFVFDQLNKATSNSLSSENIDFVKTRINDLDLSVRVLNCLNAADIDTVSELLQYSCSELRKFRNLGAKSLNEIKDLFKETWLRIKRITFESVILRRKKMSEPEDLKEKRIAELASRKSGIIPIRDFVNENEFFGMVKRALLTGLDEGLFYYLDDITKEKFRSIPTIGPKSWYFLMLIIRDALLEGKYAEQRNAIDKHFELQDGHSIFRYG